VIQVIEAVLALREQIKRTVADTFAHWSISDLSVHMPQREYKVRAAAAV
jgi:hypothetical protein